MPTIVKERERVDSKPISKSNRIAIIVVLLGITCAGALFASFLLPAESIGPATEMSLWGAWGP
jgi:hypothetical protein